MSLAGRVLSRIFRGRGSSAPGTARRGRRVSATYDAAQTTSENANHWAWADALNANASNDPSTRKTLRERSRYETDNNGYLGGLIDKLGKDLIGRGPRPQLAIPGVGRDVTRRIERAFLKWARRIGLAAKLRLLDNMAVRDGEGFGILTTNPRLPADGVQLDLRLYETDQVDTPFLDWADPLAFHGGRIDEHGNVTEWHFLKVHPGSNVWWTNYLDYDPVPSGSVVHWFNPKRAGQLRGVPEALSSLTLFAYLRRYTLATVVAAETAANLAGVLTTDTPADSQGLDVSGMDEIEIPRGALLTAPAGWSATQFKPEQPINTYAAFKGELLTEAGQPLGAPRNVSTGSSAEYNYSSGRLDHGIYQRGVGVRRTDLRDRALDQIFRAWLDEAALIPGLIPEGLPLRSEWSWEWYFDGFVALDPQKEAQANKLGLDSGTVTLAEIYADKGMDWEEAIEQRTRERKLAYAHDAPANGAPPTNQPGNPKAPGAAPGAPAKPGAPAPAATQKAAAAAGDVQGAALNGAQIASLLQITERVVSGELPAAAASAIIHVAFPLMDVAAIKQIIDALVTANPPAPEASNAA